MRDHNNGRPELSAAFDTEQAALCKSELRQEGLTLAFLRGGGLNPHLHRIGRWWRRAVALPLSIFNIDANTRRQRSY